MRRALFAAALLAALLPAGGARAQTLPAFTRTTTCDPPDPAAGTQLWWAGRPPAVTWFLYTGSVPPGCGDPVTLEALTAASFSTWAHRTCGATTSGFSFVHTSANRTASIPAFGNDGLNVVTWRKGPCSALPAADFNSCHPTGSCQDRFNCWDERGIVGSDVLALTWVTFRSSGEILDADMELNEWNGLTGAASSGYSYTCAPFGSEKCASCSTGGGCASASPTCHWADVGAIVTHEAGHVLGLDHPATGCDTTCAETMAPHIALGNAQKRILSTEDVKGVCDIYPSGGAAVQRTLAACSSSGTAVSRSSKGCGCGGGAGDAAWALLGPLLLLRRRGVRSHPHRS